MNAVSAPAVDPLAAIVSFDDFLGRFTEADRKTIARQLAVYETKAGPAAVQRWQRMACVLITLAPYPAAVLAQHGIRFFVPDGLYRKQAFAMQGQADGSLAVYTTNLLAEAVRQGILDKPRQVSGQTVYPVAETGEPLVFETYDGQTPDPAPIYKAMTGWNRKAVGVTLPPDASAAQVNAVVKLCALAAPEWAGAVPHVKTGR